jgi:hypothetical protein
MQRTMQRKSSFENTEFKVAPSPMKLRKDSSWRCRTAPSLGGGFDGTPLTAWGTSIYDNVLDIEKPTVFFGLYGFPDFYALWRHKGKRMILWAGSDIIHFINGYWLDGEGSIRISRKPLVTWINANCESYVENIVEYMKLKDIGIEAKIVPSFLGDINNYEESFVPANRPRVYISSGKDRQEEYGFGIIEEIAGKCDVEFYLYGAEWETKHENVIVRGRIPIEAMNAEVKTMQAGLRLNTMDGFSEILAKSILWGQYPISAIQYPLIDTFNSKEELIYKLNSLHTKTEPNTKAREHYREIINSYPWNENKNNKTA